MKENKIEEIVSSLESKSNEIIKNIEIESVVTYSYLKNNFSISDVKKNYLFQFIYRNFYSIR